MTPVQEERIVDAADAFGDFVHAFFVPIGAVLLALVVYVM